ncbi:disease resistance protein RGA2 [Gossypium australe]|uniref:Disease resistance protein RGA2 n=1 Tax=Gossypium australe TaxID=47621 RepID=A0A5B6VVU5_9ROSI|nr:disease resistance protein RGA2 [Gossypium australe]
MGSLLYGKIYQHDWELIRDNDIWKLDQQENDILPTYLSLFPKDTVYDTDNIIQFWMANGLLESPKQDNDGCGERFGFIIFPSIYGPRVLCKMFKIHDLIHDLVLNVSQEECLIINQQTKLKGVHTLIFPALLEQLKGERSLFQLALPKELRVIEKSFLTVCISYIKYLWLLELDIARLIPNSICTLKHLRYLNLNRCGNLCRLPKSIHKLQSLLTLRLLYLPKIQIPDQL